MEYAELSIQHVLEYLVLCGGKVENHTLVTHFKKYLKPPAPPENRDNFKKFVNTLAITRSEGDRKFVILRPKYNGNFQPLPPPPPIPPAPRLSLGIPTSPPPPPLHHPSHGAASSPLRQPPPYRPPPPVSSPSSQPYDTVSLSSVGSSTFSLRDCEDAPQVPPRRRSQDKHLLSRSESEEPKTPELPEKSVSVKERTQEFNRLASIENELSPQPQKEKKLDKDNKGADEDDGAPGPLEQKRREWIVAMARGDYQALAKMALDMPRLVKTKDPFTNGGYTALHIAMQFGHKEVYELLTRVYGANPDVRDWSGRLALSYSSDKKTAISKDAIRKLKTRKKNSEKDLGFLRIGSLNVRVKKTTEAFSNFLGVGGGMTVAPSDQMVGVIHKSWGSADNVAQESMPAPKVTTVLKKKNKRNSESRISRSTPGTPNQMRNSTGSFVPPDSDSDTACGFDANWKN